MASTYDKHEVKLVSDSSLTGLETKLNTALEALRMAIGDDLFSLLGVRVMVDGSGSGYHNYIGQITYTRTIVVE